MLVELSVMEQRYQAVMEVLGAHVPVTEVAERYGVSRQAVHRWIRHYRSGGIGALIDQPKTPRSSPLRLDPAVEAAICEMRRNHRRWGPRTLAYWLGQDGIDPVPARSTIYRVLVRNHLIVPVPRKRKRESYVRWERDEPMELWQHDFISGVFLKSGRELKVVTGIDDHSRFCVLAKVVTRASGRQVSLAFAQALATYGIPDEVLSDNGVQFTNRLIKRKTMGESLFERICRDNNIVQRFTKVASPTTTGKIERLHLTMREMLEEHGPFDDVEEAQDVFDTWRAEYNEIRPHQSLDMATPASRFVPRPETVADLVLARRAAHRGRSPGHHRARRARALRARAQRRRSRPRGGRVHPCRCPRAGTSRSASSRSGSDPSGPDERCSSGPTRSRCTCPWTASISRPCPRG